MSDLCKCGHAKGEHQAGTMNCILSGEPCDCRTFRGRPAGKSQGAASAGEPPEVRDPLTAPADRDDLAAILAKHQIIKTGDMGTDLLATTCLCGEQLLNSYAGGAPIERAEWHAAHLAAMVFGSDWLRDVKAGTWDECHESGTPWENPYRADRADNTTDRT